MFDLEREAVYQWNKPTVYEAMLFDRVKMLEDEVGSLKADKLALEMERDAIKEYCDSLKDGQGLLPGVTN